MEGFSEKDLNTFMEIMYKFSSMFNGKKVSEGLAVGMSVICTMIDTTAEICKFDALQLADEIANAVVNQHMEKPELYSKDI